jgi:hypothetical protein
MQIGRIPGATRVAGTKQGYLGLPIRDELITEKVNGPRTPSMVTAWLPMPHELKALADGAAVYVRILGEVPPPMMVAVGDAPPPAPPGEFEHAIKLAELILDRVGADPDDDVAVLARQFLRTIGRI